MRATRINTKRPITETELLKALRESMVVVFRHFEEELAKADGKELFISITKQGNETNLKYGISDLPPNA